MRQLSYGLVCISFLFQPGLLFAAGLSNLEQGNLISAIDDYHFSDYDIAINKLENLYQKAPDNAEVLQYLALSYDENNKSNKAIPLFQAWLKNHNNTTSKDSRFAWLGLANAYMKTHQLSKATNTLQTWVNANPDDVQSQVTLGDMLIRQKKYAESKPLWENILASNIADSSDKAAAWYYKSWLAYLEGDAQNTKEYAQNSLQTDPEGAYVSAAKKLEANPSQQRLGFNGFGAIESFYNSNVTFVPSKSGLYGGDKGMQATLVLGWGFPRVHLDYTFSGTRHEDRTAYDLIAHGISASWKKDATWRFKPSYESISLNYENLYQAAGLSTYYSDKKWTYRYTMKLKQYSKNYGQNGLSLERLNSNSHLISAKTKLTAYGINFTAEPQLIFENTKGDATHNKSDSYYQYGINVSADIPLSKRWTTEIKSAFHSRNYYNPDTNILLNPTDQTVRNDTYLKLATSLAYKASSTNDIYIRFNASYLINASNYDAQRVTPTASKSYDAWRIGAMMTTQW